MRPGPLGRGRAGPTRGTAMMRQRLDLDGSWQIAFDPDNAGNRREWARWERFQEDAPREPIEVPACWERFREDYEGVAWYGRTFRVPGGWQGRSVRIHFGAVNYLSEVWVNDSVIGHHEGGYTDFAFEIGDVLRFGEENTVVVRVVGPIVAQDIEIDGMGRNDMPHWRGAIAGGIWQPVRLVASDPVYVSDLFVCPNRSLTGVRVRLAVENTTLRNRELRARLSVVPLGAVRNGDRPGGSIADDIFSRTMGPGENILADDILLARPGLWSPEEPFLYRLEAELLDGDDAIDAHSVRFGMRQLVIEGNEYLLNGRPTLVKSTFFEGLYPTTLAAPPDAEFVRHELQLAKDAGFNLIRPWRKPQPPIVYDLADEMGMMFVGSMPIECMRRWPTMTPYAEDRMKNEVRESVRRDRNHPCIIMWEVFNEIGRDDLRRIKHRVSREARKLDPSRVILDESGGWAGGASVYPPGTTEPMRINDVHGYPGAPLDQEGYDSYLALAKTEDEIREMGIRPFAGNSAAHLLPGAFTHISEMGYGSLPDLEANCEQYRREGNPLTPDYRYHHEMLDHFTRALTFTDLDELFPSVRDFCMVTQETHAQANKLMVEAARMNPDVKGFGIHAYTDGDWIVGAGLLDIFRNPKKPYYAACETNQPVYLALRTSERNVYGPAEVALTANVASELAEPFDARLEAEVVAGDGTVVASRQCAARIERGPTALLRESLPTDGLSGLLTLRGKLYKGDRLITENAYEFRVVPAEDVIAPQAGFAALDPSGALQAFADSGGMACEEFGGETAADLIVLANAGALWRRGREGKAKALVEFAQSGGTVIYLDLPMGKQVGPWFQDGVLAAPWLPVQLLVRQTRGLWTPFAHVIRDHPVARGLPAGKAMDYDYVNVFPRASIIHVAKGDPIVPRRGMDFWSWLGEGARRAPACTLGLGYNRGSRLEDLDYRGPGPVIFGADLLDLPCGAGRIVLSTLRLVASLGRDPVADILLANIADWAAKMKSAGG
jgi:beta-galactosidase